MDELCQLCFSIAGFTWCITVEDMGESKWNDTKCDLGMSEDWQALQLGCLKEKLSLSISFTLRLHIHVYWPVSIEIHDIIRLFYRLWKQQRSLKSEEVLSAHLKPYSPIGPMGNISSPLVAFLSPCSGGFCYFRAPWEALRWTTLILRASWHLHLKRALAKVGWIQSLGPQKATVVSCLKLIIIHRYPLVMRPMPLQFL